LIGDREETFGQRFIEVFLPAKCSLHCGADSNIYWS